MDEEEEKEHVFDFNLQHELEELMMEDLHF